MSNNFQTASFAGFFKILSDETRLRILALLRDNELSVGELQKILEVGQSTLSSQLGQLRDHKLATTRKEGQKVYYRLSSEVIESEPYEILHQALEKLETATVLKEDQSRLEQVLKERSESSKLFFDSYKDQDPPSPGQTWESLGQGLLNILREKTVVDLGCGSGKLCFMLYQSGKNAIGIDNSDERIKIATQKFSDTLKNSKSEAPQSGSLQFLKADMENTKLPNGSADLVILSQSLHHVAKPVTVLKEASRLLTPSGKLLILDLHAHQQEWIREKFGDFWLGFDPKDLRLWLSQNGFEENPIITTQPTSTPEIQTLILIATKIEK